jgi:hypothetical protein
LLLGLLVGLCVANFAPASLITTVMALTIAGLAASVLFSKFTQHAQALADKKASERAVLEMERRMERLIPKRNMKAHGGHSHRPHAMQDSESDWMPVTRRGRSTNSHR